MAVFFELLPFLIKLGPPRFRRFLWTLLPFATTRKLRHYVDTMWTTAVEILGAKRKALEAGEDAILQQVGEGKDIMSLLSATSRIWTAP